jgi:hypothetical protein
VNAVLLILWATGALVVTVLPVVPPLVRAVAGGLAMGYAVVCGSFVRQRRRAVAAGSLPTTVTPTTGDRTAG